MASAARTKCSRCLKSAILMCFCKELPFCQSCIGAHLAEGGPSAHNTVMLNDTAMLEIMRGGASQLHKARERVISEQQEVLKRKSTVLDRIATEIAAITAFEEHTMDLIETISSALVGNLIRARKAMGTQVKESCLKLKMQLEDVRASLDKSTGMDSLEVLKAFPALEILEKPLITMNSEYQEIDIDKLFKAAFRLTVEWAFSTSETARLLDPDTSELLTVDLDTLRTVSKKPVSGLTPAYQASICLLPNSEFLITGGGIKNQGALIGALEAATVLTESLSLSQLPPMNSQRMGHGSIYMSSFAFVVGGWPVSNLCERYSFADKVWERISNLKQGRSYPGICEFEGKIYVAGGHEVDSIEMYIPSQDLFMALGIRLSAPGRCGMVAVSDCILAFHGDNVSKLMPLKSVSVRERGVGWRTDIWPQHPIIASKDLVIVFLQGRVWRYKPSDKDLNLVTETSA